MKRSQIRNRSAWLHAWIQAMLSLLLVLGSAASRAEDTDLFISASANSAEVPNVLIVLDNTANWNTPFSNQMAALRDVFNNLPVNRFRVGLMMFTETGRGDSNADGAYVRAAIRLMDSSTRSTYANLITSLDVGADKSNGGKLGKTMVEVHRYYSGLAPYAGNNKNKTDYTSNTTGTTQSRAVYALTGNALTAKDGTRYTSPVVAGCGKNYVIYISNGAVQDNAADTSDAKAVLAALTGADTSQIPISPSGSAENVADEWARYLKRSSLGITSYTLDVNKLTTGQGPGWTALLKSMASVSGGRYFDVASEGTQIRDALNRIFSEIQAANSVFASVSLPVSVNTKDSFLNQVFIGMFRPDGDALPRWAGNLKQYKLGRVGGVFQTVDADGGIAINAQTGFIGECARSFWTPNVLDSEWATRPDGSCLAVAGSPASNYPDGNIVDKGAQSYTLRQSATRNLKTCTPGACTSMVDFSSTQATQARLGAASATERDALISWARGLDQDDENINGSTTDRRLSIHGDVVHSRPVALNHGTDAVPNVVVYYGANDGMLRAINGNQTRTFAGVQAGGELWSFIPPESYGLIKRIRDNSIAVSFVGSTSTVTMPKPYGMDGPVTAYTDASNMWVYSTMRRGGRMVYGFNVSSPANPTLLWAVGCPNLNNDTGCTSGLTQLGQTWSPPVPFKAKGIGGGATPLLIMGGGYDNCEDSDPNTCSTTKGNRVYVLNAQTGAVLATFNTDRAVSAEVSILKNGNTGFADYAYTADMGGNVYRIAIGEGATTTWAITKIASLGCSTPASCASNRKFLFSPDVISDGSVNYLMLGSGDREKPVVNYTANLTVSNKFFVLRDKPTDSAWLSSEATNCAGTAIICMNSLISVNSVSVTTAAFTAAALDSKKGWYLNLRNQEQVVTNAVTLFGVTTYSTHQPAQPTPGMCGSNLGTARTYNVYFSTGRAYEMDVILAGGGLPPSPVAGKVDGVNFIIGGCKDSPLQACERKAPPVAGTGVKSRLYWYIQK